MSTNDNAPLRVYMTGSEWFGTLPGGLNRYFEDLFVALQERDDVNVRAAAFGEPRFRGESWGPLRGGLVRRISASRHTPMKAPDVLDRHFAPYGPSRSSSKAGNLVTHFQGPWFAESLATGEERWKAAIKRSWESQRHSEADRAVVLCEDFAGILSERLDYPRDRIVVIPPGVDLDRFAFAPAVETSRPLVLCVRRLERRMGIDVLLNAWPAVIDAIPEARLGIVGHGAEAGSIQSQIAELKIPASVTMHGRVDDHKLVALYAESAVTVVPTRELEGFGLIALESLAMGRPAVVTDVGGLPDAVVGLDQSLVVPSEDSTALAQRLVQALRGATPSPERCRAHAEESSWARVAERHYELYRGMMST